MKAIEESTRLQV